jgi:hypothetical protein
MPASYMLLRLLMGGLCVFFAYYLGQSLALRGGGRTTNANAMRWGLRVTVTALGTAWGGLDLLTLLALGLAALAAGYGYYAGQRPRPPEEDLTKLLFPKDKE